MSGELTHSSRVINVRSARIDRGGVIADVAEGVGLRHALAISVPNPIANDRRFM